MERACLNFLVPCKHDFFCYNLNVLLILLSFRLNSSKILIITFPLTTWMQGISTYDYIVALREQKQQEHSEHQSPQMSIISSVTGLSTTSSFGPLHRRSWCTPPRLLVEDQVQSLPYQSIKTSLLIYSFFFVNWPVCRTKRQQFLNCYTSFIWLSFGHL